MVVSMISCSLYTASWKSQGTTYDDSQNVSNFLAAHMIETTVWNVAAGRILEAPEGNDVCGAKLSLASLIKYKSCSHSPPLRVR